MSEPLWFYGVLFLAAFLTGVSKAGFSGFSIVSVALLAWAFEALPGGTALASIGYLLPLLIVADISVYPPFRHWGSWRQVWPLLVPMLVGVLTAWLCLKSIPDHWARPAIGCIILVLLAMQIWRRYGNDSFRRVAHSRSFGLAAGIAGGFATMLANAAGPIVQLFLLSRGMPKMEMIGVGARLFLIVNALKIPLMGNVGLITSDTLKLNLLAVPFILLGVFIGKRYLVKVPQKLFEQLVIITAGLSAIRLLIP